MSPGTQPQITRGTTHIKKVKNGLMPTSSVVSEADVKLAKKLDKPNTKPKIAPYMGPRNTAPTARGRQLSVIVIGPKRRLPTVKVSSKMSAASSAANTGLKSLGAAFFFVIAIIITSCCFPGSPGETQIYFKRRLFGE